MRSTHFALRGGLLEVLLGVHGLLEDARLGGADLAGAWLSW